MNGAVHWTVRQPQDPIEAAYTRNFLNVYYGKHVLSVQGGTVVDLVNRALEDFSSEELGE